MNPSPTPHPSFFPSPQAGSRSSPMEGQSFPRLSAIRVSVWTPKRHQAGQHFNDNKECINYMINGGGHFTYFFLPRTVSIPIDRSAPKGSDDVLINMGDFKVQYRVKHHIKIKLKIQSCSFFSQFAINSIKALDFY